MNTIALIKTGNEAITEDGKFNQMLQCAKIDAYTDATAELSKFITKLYKDKNPNANIIYNTLKPLIDNQNKNYDSMVELLNDVSFMDNESEQ
jgi:hypothetical protein